MISRSSLFALLVSACASSAALRAQGPVTELGWSAELDQAGARFGSAIASGDLNGDGLGDIVVGAPLFDGGEEDEGLVVAYFGSAAGLVAAGWFAQGDRAGAEFGHALACADLDGDGADDLIVGAWRFGDAGAPDRGRVFVWYGSAAGLGPDGTPENADWSADVQAGEVRFGNGVTGADLNGDGFGDVVVGAYRYGSSREGAVFAWFGGRLGLGENGDASNAGWLARGSAPDAEFGAALARVDATGDGIDDLLVGAPGFRDATGGPAGQAYLFPGSIQGGPAAVPTWVGQGAESFGKALGSAGDLDGDGAEEFLVGAPLHSSNLEAAGAAFLFPGGSRQIPPTPIWSTFGREAHEQLGAQVAGAGDVNGDGVRDFVIGSPGDSSATPLESAGRVDLYLGSTAAGDLPAAPAWSDLGPGPGSLFGAAIAPAVDVDGDALHDVIVGAPGASNGQQFEGMGFLFPGNGGLGEPPDLDAVTLNPTEVDAGDPSTLTIHLSKNAPLAGTPVTLLSDQPGLASVPGNIVIPGGNNTWDVAVMTVANPQESLVTLTAMTNGQSAEAILTVHPGFPQFFEEPPETLLIGDFKFTALSYSTKEWDFDNNVMTNASGDGEMTLVCDGNNATVQFPFQNLTIEPVVQGTGKVIVGSVSYPGSPPPPMVLDIAGFKLLVDSFTLEPNTAEAAARLQFPGGIVDASSEECTPAEIDLGAIPFNPQCRVFREDHASAWGPWEITSTGMKILGSGFLVDLSTVQSAPGPYPPMPPLWRGVFLDQGATDPVKTEVVSNTGYLHGPYRFQYGSVTAAGLTASFDASFDAVVSSYIFTTVQPHGYRIEYTGGTLAMVDNQISSGLLKAGKIRLPAAAVRSQNNLSVEGAFDELDVQADLDLAGTVTFEDEMYWGELTGASPLRAFSYVPSIAPDNGHAYFSASYRPEYYPLVGDSFQLPTTGPGDVFGHLESQNIQGLTFIQPDSTPKFRIYTPDIPDGDQLPLPEPIRGLFIVAPFVNVVSQGVHGQIGIIETEPDTGSGDELGPSYRSDYEGGPDKNGTPAAFRNTFLNADPDQSLFFQFVDSAVYHSDGHGEVDLPEPTGVILEYSAMNFTSTAQIAAAKVVIDLLSPAKLDYWELDLGQKAGASEAGVLHVRSGRIFLTNATLAEPRHFAKPFCLTWAVIRANGQIGEIHFNFDSSGQEFDGFGYNPAVLALSDWVPDDTLKENAFLQAAGTIHFDFFGEYYLDIRDHVLLPPAANVVNGGRDIFMEDDGLNGALPSELMISGSWAGSFGDMGYGIEYDKGDYDGFFGDGLMALAYVSDDLDSSVNLTSERICMTVLDDVDDGFEDLRLPPVANFTKMGRTTGCGCIEDGVLKRVHLQSELENAGNLSVMVRAAEYMSLEMDLTPSTTSLDLHGEMFLNMGPGGFSDLEVVGSAGFLVDTDEDFVEGHVDGRFDAASFLSMAGGLNAEGQLSWHIGSSEGGYHSMQGRVAVGIVAPLGAMGTGVEGGFYAGRNAPESEAWVLKNTDPKFVDFTLPERLTGAYGYAKFAKSLNLYVLSGGYEIYGGLGLFVANDIPGPFGQMRAHVWGEFLGGLLSASAWAQMLLQVHPSNPAFKGAVGLEVCALFVLCQDINLNLEIDKNGFDIDD